MNADAALNWYGISSLILGLMGSMGYVMLNGNTRLVAIGDWWTNHLRYFFPVGMTWFMTRFFGNYGFLTETLKAVTSLSILAPFMQHWIAIGWYIDANENNYGDLDFWIIFLGYAFTTLVEMLIQVTVLPKVYQGIGEGKFDGQDSDIIIWG